MSRFLSTYSVLSTRALSDRPIRTYSVGLTSLSTCASFTAQSSRRADHGEERDRAGEEESGRFLEGPLDSSWFRDRRDFSRPHAAAEESPRNVRRGIGMPNHHEGREACRRLTNSPSPPQTKPSLPGSLPHVIRIGRRPSLRSGARRFASSGQKPS